VINVVTYGDEDIEKHGSPTYGECGSNYRGAIADTDERNPNNILSTWRRNP